jgi:quercetin dioxygenase-like cupin family protein
MHMMKHFVGCAAALLTVGVLWTTASVAQQSPPKGSQEKGEALVRLQPIDRFDSRTNIRTKKGGIRNLHVVIRNWELHGRQRIAKFPAQGFMVVQLHSGQVITTIDGKEQQHNGGDFWTVPAGSSMSLQVTSESALLQIMAASP